MTNYDVTIGYKAVICASIKAENEEQAKELALKEVEKFRTISGKSKLSLQDDTFTVAGVLDMDQSWNLL